MFLSGSKDCLLPQRPTKDNTVPISRYKTINPAEGFPELASENTESCKTSESVQSSSSSSSFVPFGAEPMARSHGGGLMPEPTLHPPFSCLTAGMYYFHCTGNVSKFVPRVYLIYIVQSKIVFANACIIV